MVWAKIWVVVPPSSYFFLRHHFPTIWKVGVPYYESIKINTSLLSYREKKKEWTISYWSSSFSFWDMTTLIHSKEKKLVDSQMVPNQTFQIKFSLFLILYPQVFLASLIFFAYNTVSTSNILFLFAFANIRVDFVCGTYKSYQKKLGGQKWKSFIWQVWFCNIYE